MLRDSVIAAVRTGVAAAVGIFITYLIKQGIEVDESLTSSLSLAITAIIIAVYNWAVILLETKVNPIFGILLGVPKSPSYDV